MRDLETVDLADLIPSSIADDPQVKAAVEALNGELQSCTDQIKNAVLIARIDELDSDTLDQLAWHYNVLFYKTGFALSQKRGAIKQALYWRRIAGTKAAIAEGLASLQYSSSISEWFEFSGDPYTFEAEVNVADSPVTETLFTDIVEIIDKTKNTRSHLTRMRVAAEPPVKIYAGAANYSGAYVAVGGELAVIMSRTPVELSATAQAVSTAIATLRSRVTELLMIATESSPFFQSWNTDVVPAAKLADLTTTNTTDIDCSPNGKFVALLLSASPYLQIWKRTLPTDSFTTVAAPATMPTGGDDLFENKLSFSLDSQYLALRNGTSTTPMIYQISGDTFTALTVPTGITGTINSLKFGPNNILAVGRQNGNVTFYKVTGSTVSILATNLVTGLNSITAVRTVAWHPTGSLFYFGGGNVGSTNTFHSFVYSFDGVNSFSLLYNYGNTTEIPVCADFSNDGTKLAITGLSMTAKVYQISGTTLTELTGITSTGSTVAKFNTDSTKLALGSKSQTTTNLYIYNISDTTLTLQGNPSPWPNGGVRGAAWLPKYSD